MPSLKIPETFQHLSAFVECAAPLGWQKVAKQSLRTLPLGGRAGRGFCYGWSGWGVKVKPHPIDRKNLRKLLF